MNKSTRDSFILPIIVTVIGAFVITPIANAYYDPHSKVIPIVTPTLKFLSFIWNDCLNYKMPVWIFVISILIIIYVFIRIIRRKFDEIDNYSTREFTLLDDDPPYNNLAADYLNYTQDKLKGWLWGWEYKWDESKNDYTIEQLRPICSYCKIKSIDSIPNVETVCPNCDNKYNIHVTAATGRNKIKALNEHKIENHLY